MDFFFINWADLPDFILPNGFRVKRVINHLTEISQDRDVRITTANNNWTPEFFFPVPAFFDVWDPRYHFPLI